MVSHGTPAYPATPFLSSDMHEVQRAMFLPAHVFSLLVTYDNQNGEVDVFTLFLVFSI